MKIWQIIDYIIRYANVWCLLAIVECIFLIISARENHIIKKDLRKSVYHTSGLIIIAAIADMIGEYAYAINGLQMYVFLGYSIVYTIPMIVPVVFSSTMDQTFIKTASGKRMLLISVVYTISMLTNYWHGLYFTIDPTGNYVQGSAWYIRPILFSVQYFAVFSSIMKKKYILSFGDIRTINHLLILLIIGIIYTDIYYAGEIIELIMASGFSFITSMFINLKLKTDQVTRLANRAIYTNDAIKNKDKEDLVVVSIDINDLKKINDNEGHAAGDAYLKATALTYNKHLHSYGKLYRTGGDEFVFLGYNKAAIMKELEKLSRQERTDREYGDYELSAAYGLVEKEKDETVFDAVNRADALMYDCKRRMKSAF
jgi:diguanylate cyclase (GGDEF)-like protein